MNQKNLILITLAVLGILVVFMMIDFKKKGESFGSSVSQNILYLTQPVTSFSGVVDKIEGNRIFVTQKITSFQNMVPPVAINPSGTPPSPQPTPKSVIITYQVIVTDKTDVFQPMPYVNYLLKTVTPVPQVKLAVKNIRVGQNITVNSQTDLRTLSGNTVEATTINLPQITNTLSGTIVSVEGNALTLKAFAPVNNLVAVENTAVNPASREREYRVILNSDTEISRSRLSTAPTTPGEILQAPKSEKLTLSDLKKDTQIMVYTDKDVTENQNLTALRIEPMIAPIISPFPLPSAPATSSSVTTTPIMSP